MLGGGSPLLQEGTVPRSYPERPWVGVGVVVLHQDRVLLVRRGKPPRLGQWSLPGGVQELGETVHEAGRREVREETGLEIEIFGLIDVFDSVQRDEAGRVRFHYTLIDLAAHWRSGVPLAGDDAADAAWMPLAEIGALGLWSETERAIRTAAHMRERLDTQPASALSRKSSLS